MLNNVYVNILQYFIYEYLFKNKIEQKKRFAELNTSRLVCLLWYYVVDNKKQQQQKKLYKKQEKNWVLSDWKLKQKRSDKTVIKDILKKLLELEYVKAKLDLGGT